MKQLNVTECQAIAGGLCGDSTCVLVSSDGIPSYYYQLIDTNMQASINEQISDAQFEANLSGVPEAYIVQYYVNFVIAATQIS